MFVPLPVPFVFQRTAPDLNAWRLKSPLALRSNSGKTFFSSSPSATHPPCRPGLAMQTRPTLLGADALAAGRVAGAHAQAHAHRDTLLRLLSQASTESFTLAGRLVEFKKKQKKRTLSSALEIPK